MTVLHVRGLRVFSRTAEPVRGIDLEVDAGECVAVLAESGAGKSLTARALLGLVPPGLRSSADALVVAGTDTRRFGERDWRRLRGASIALVSQDALVSFDPLRRVGAEVAEPVRIHEPALGRAARAARVLRLLDDVAMPEPALRARQHPHELSGGLRQRALIASALAAGPAVLVADEPTTALDATVQARVLDLLRRIADEGVAVVLVTHDLAAIRRVADRVLVLDDGRVVESGATARILDAPGHRTTRALVAAAARRPRPPAVDVGPAVLTADALVRAFGDRRAVDDVSLALHPGRTLAVVGESGSGKTTLARMLAGVDRPDAGAMTCAGGAWDVRVARGPLRRRVQLVAQDPTGALDARWRIERSLREALAAAGTPRAARRAAVAALLEEVGLDPELAGRRPAQLSGGQRQRVAIARALAVEPDVLILDEPVSGLDVRVRERILERLRILQRERGIAMLLVTHDLDVVAGSADDVLVMRGGRVVESGPVARVFAEPAHPFTRELLAAASVGPAVDRPVR